MGSINLVRQNGGSSHLSTQKNVPQFYLPNELWQKIFSFLSMLDAMTAMRVCKKWKTVMESIHIELAKKQFKYHCWICPRTGCRPTSNNIQSTVILLNAKIIDKDVIKYQTEYIRNSFQSMICTGTPLETIEFASNLSKFNMIRPTENFKLYNVDISDLDITGLTCLFKIPIKKIELNKVKMSSTSPWKGINCDKFTLKHTILLRSGSKDLLHIMKNGAFKVVLIYAEVDFLSTIFSYNGSGKCSRIEIVSQTDDTLRQCSLMVWTSIVNWKMSFVRDCYFNDRLILTRAL